MRVRILLLILVSVLLEGCLRLDWIADGSFEPYGRVRLVGSNGTVYHFDYTSRAHLMFSSDRSVIRMGFPSGATVEVATPPAEGLHPTDGFVAAAGVSQNFDIRYSRHVVCDMDRARFHQQYAVILLARGSDLQLGKFTGRGPQHLLPDDGTCPTP
jgi:hypothetical protein